MYMYIYTLSCYVLHSYFGLSTFVRFSMSTRFFASEIKYSTDFGYILYYKAGPMCSQKRKQNTRFVFVEHIGPVKTHFPRTKLTPQFRRFFFTKQAPRARGKIKKPEP